MKNPKIDNERVRLYRGLTPQAFIAKTLYVTNGYVRDVIRVNISNEDRVSIKRKIYRGVSSQWRRKSNIRASYIRNGVRNLWCNKGMRDKLEIAGLLRVSEGKVGEIVMELGI